MVFRSSWWKRQIEWALPDWDTLPEGFADYKFVPDRNMEPVRVIVEKQYASVPDYCTGPMTSLVVVSKNFKLLVEKYESGMHWFIPIELTKANGEVWEGTHFIFKVGCFVKDGIVLEKSHVKAKYYEGVLLRYATTSTTPRIMWKASQVGKRHIWSDEKLKDVIAVSDAFFEALKCLDVSGFRSLESRLDADFGP
ncbi:imm11 family protein [Pseudovibrio brasiliensis]|uniref:Immunity MXAN-0049 protein domain-containing protein n=1 Tax=Pseudovibrio brasiliensis TaxID=1898042 RepID=A0ABX8ANF7_9HYPH|nr:DUF1629 domain-containing protein [Pseudovibrio brasiliensis]QUS55246.1 hypothetical protein KGB56_18170 [Pseudovibrio brasiliensis]